MDNEISFSPESDDFHSLIGCQEDLMLFDGEMKSSSFSDEEKFNANTEGNSLIDDCSSIDVVRNGNNECINQAGEISEKNLIDLSSLCSDSIPSNIGLPEKYFLPSPNVKSQSHEVSGGISSFPIKKLTRTEPMGEESDNGDSISQDNDYSDVEDAISNDSFSDEQEEAGVQDSAYDYDLDHRERPPLVGQSNDPRGQVASGMSCSSSNGSSSYSSAISGSLEDIFLCKSDIRDPLSMKVSKVVGDGNFSKSSSEDSQLEDKSTETLIADKMTKIDLKDEILDEMNESFLSGKSEAAENNQDLQVPVDSSKDFNHCIQKLTDMESFSLQSEKLDCVNQRPESSDTFKDISFSDYRPASPTSVSSIASSKRLEWDSGADIGYKRVSAELISQTEAEVLHWANHHLPLTRTEPEGKSYQKEKRIPNLVKKMQMTGNAKEHHEPEKTVKLPKESLKFSELDSSMASIISEIYKEDLYGSCSNANTSNLELEDDVIVRVRKLLSQSSRQENSSEDDETSTHNDFREVESHPSEEIFSQSHSKERNSFDSGSNSSIPIYPETSPSHSSSSWSAKSSHTVVMTPSFQNIEECNSPNSEHRRSKNSDFQFDNPLFYGSRDFHMVQLNSVSVQTDSDSQICVPRPIFPTGKSKSLDILPTVLVDASVNTDLLYSSSEDNLEGYRHESIKNSQEQLYSSSGTVVPKGVSSSLSHICDKRDVGTSQISHKRVNYSNESKSFNQRSSSDAALPFTTYCDAPRKENYEMSSSNDKILMDNCHHGSTNSIISNKEEKARKRDLQSPNQVTPYWPNGSNSMYYTVDVNVPKKDNSNCMSEAQTFDEEWILLRKDSGKKQTLFTSETKDSNQNPDVSDECSSRGMLSSSKKIVDRTQWLQEMIRLEKNSDRKQDYGHSSIATYGKESCNDNNLWHQLSTDSSLSFLSSSDLSVDLQNHKKIFDKKNKAKNSVSKSSLRTQLAELKNLVIKQRENHLKHLLREIYKIEKLENLIPDSPSLNSDSATTACSSDADVWKSIKKKKKKFKNEVHKILHDLGNNPKYETGPAASDFGQMYPSPVPQASTEKSEKSQILTVIEDKVSENNGQSKYQAKNIKNFCQMFPSPVPQGSSEKFEKSQILTVVEDEVSENNSESNCQAKNKDFCQMFPSHSPQALTNVKKKIHSVGQDQVSENDEKIKLESNNTSNPHERLPSRVHIEVREKLSSPSINQRFKNEKVMSANKTVSVGIQTNKDDIKVNNGTMKPVGWVIPVSRSGSTHGNFEHISLQEALRKKHPLVKKLEDRHSYLNVVANSRKGNLSRIRKEIKNIALASDSNKNEHLLKFPSSKVKDSNNCRIFTHEEMRAQTMRKYRQLPEVVRKKEELKRLYEYKTNRIIAKVYHKRLQQSTLKGQVNWNYSQKCLNI